MLNNPIAQQVLMMGIDTIGKKMLEDNTKEENLIDKSIERIDELQKKLEKEKNNRIIESPNNEVSNIEDKQENNEDQSYSNYAPDMNIDSGCIPCSKAHLLGVKGALNEALRFAREDGVNHPEVIKRLDMAGEELVIMERFDLSPEKIANSPKDQQEIVKENLPKIRRLRQKVVNQIKSADDLEEVAALASNIYDDIKKLDSNNQSLEEGGS